MVTAFQVDRINKYRKFKLFFSTEIYTHVFRRNERNKNHLIAYTLLLSHGTHQQTQIAQKVTKYFIIRTVIVSYFFDANKATTVA